MKLIRYAVTLVVAVIALAIVGVAVSVFTANELFFNSAWQSAALASIAFITATILTFAVIGRPWRLTYSTPYW
jgi:VIT1/CCC1 family predicted Fe2+/Mn2+ transporter